MWLSAMTTRRADGPLTCASPLSLRKCPSAPCWAGRSVCGSRTVLLNELLANPVRMTEKFRADGALG